jgi:predicted GNAT family acetyltransferase
MEVSEPEIRILHPGDEAALETFLLPRVEWSMFLIGNLRASGLMYTGKPYSGTYAAAFDDQLVVGAAAHYWNGILVLQAPVHRGAVWRAAVKASQRAIEGLVGPNEQVSTVVQALGIDATMVQLDEVERLYSLQLADLLIPASLSSGRVSGRRIRADDIEFLTAWRVAYAIETQGERDTPELWQRSRAGIERAVQEGHGWVLECDGEAVAYCAFNAAIKEAVQLGGVYTPPPLRRRGYGRAVVAASLLDARREGVGQAILFTGVSNLPAQRAYTALGFRHIGQYRMVLLEPPLKVKQ